MDHPAINVVQAVKIYDDQLQALQDVTFQVQPGEFFGLLGPNGAGKTTLLSAIAGLTALTSGSISVHGHDVRLNPYVTRMTVGLVPQEVAIDPFFTVRETLTFQSGYFGLTKNDDWIDEVMTRLGLAEKAHANMRQLSGGMRRRVMVAQALVHRPPVIILDEPTAGVDVELRQSLWGFIIELNKKGHTIILTTHYLEEAQNLCDRVAVMRKGQLVALDSTDHLLRSSVKLQLHLDLDGLLPEALHADVIRSDGQHYVLQLESYSQIADALSVVKQNNLHIKKLHLAEPSLEDVFLQLTRNHLEA